jgi:Arc/MetJ-type ribon-helix-helix transcriptional regulator
MHIDISEETGRVVDEELRQGHFRSVDELIQSGLKAWKERHLPPTLVPEEPIAERETRPIWEVITERVKGIPDEVFDRMPQNALAQIDHYIYGTPKRGS